MKVKAIFIVNYLNMQNTHTLNVVAQVDEWRTYVYTLAFTCDFVREYPIIPVPVGILRRIIQIGKHS